MFARGGYRMALPIVGVILALTATTAAAIETPAGHGVTAGPAGRGATSSMRAQRLGWLDKKANIKHTWLYVTDFDTNAVFIYDLDKSGFQVGVLQQGIKGPDGVTIDASGAVYVANDAAGTVTVYPAGQTYPSLTLSDGLQIPIAVAVDTNGDVYVTNKGTSPSVVVYPPGKTTPSRFITSKLLVMPGQVAFDTGRNLYVSDNATGVSEIPYGGSQLVSLGLQGLTFPSGLAVDPATGDLYVSQASKGSTLVFPAGSVKASRVLKESEDFDLLAFGTLNKRQYLLGPTSSTGVVKFYKPRAKKPFALFATQAQNAVSAAIKPPGVP
jgi:DNA-binding beta-propeller fold protein YncE